MVTIQKMPSILLEQRNALLQEALRPGFQDYSIESEYPIILKPGKDNFSYCTVAPGKNHRDQELLAHANLWPRTLICHDSGKSVKVGLVGNVATKRSSRGQGLMNRLLQFLWDHAKNQDLKALILWSDLTSFYQKMGFKQKGTELRLFLYRDDLKNVPDESHIVSVIPASSLSLRNLDTLLKLRFQTPASLHRSAGEFKTLLSIPDTMLLIQGSLSSLFGYCILGKGFDMPGVIHEWGAFHPEIILNIIRHILVTTEWEFLMLLSPPLNRSPWLKPLTTVARKVETHPLGHIRTVEGSTADKIFRKSFLWGLDTI